jgi:SAM-dependent methyltransferase
MKPTTDSRIDYKQLVHDGYNACAEAFAAAREGGPPALDLLLSRLSPGAEVLDLGCGCGVSVARVLAAAHHRVTGVDFASEQIRLARRNVPSATFLEADIASLQLEASSLNAVVAFYVLFHLPRAEQLHLLRSIWRWLKPGGYFLGSLSLWNEEPYTEDFFGVPMFWTNFGLEAYLEFLQEIGYQVLETSMLGHGYGSHQNAEAHPLVFAIKPSADAKRPPLARRGACLTRPSTRRG